MTDGITLSQGKSSGEEDDQGIQCCFPAVCPGSRFSSSLTGNVPQAEVQQIHRRLVGREMSTRLGHLPELEVDGFDGIRRVHDSAQLDRVVEEWDELVPGSPPHVDHTGILAAPFGVEVLERDLGGLEAQTSGIE